jgi:hypothetical protein
LASTSSLFNLSKSTPATSLTGGLGGTSTTATSDSKPLGTGFSLTKPADTTTAIGTSNLTQLTDANKASTTLATDTNLPNVVSFALPSSKTDKIADTSKGLGLGGSLTTSMTTKTTTQPGSIGSTSTGGAIASGTAIASTIKQQSLKDQNLPQMLMDCVENFK